MDEIANCNPKPMAAWLNESEQDNDCKPCKVAVLVPDYQATLSEAGYGTLASEFTSTLDKETDDIVLDIANLMDKSKENVDGDTRTRLLALDCMAQNKE